LPSEVSGVDSAPTEITSANEHVSAYGWKALAGSVIGFSMDGFDMLILGFMLSAISAALALTSTQAGSLVTWTMLGAVAGGLVFGTVSDHLGRIKVLTWTILIFAVFTGLCALARGYWDLVAYRAIAGVGLGGEYGIGMALAAEAWPSVKRARASSYVMVGWHGGVLLAASVTAMLLPVIGLAKDGETFKTTLGIAILCTVQNFAYYGIMIWMPSYLGRVSASASPSLAYGPQL